MVLSVATAGVLGVGKSIAGWCAVCVSDACPCDIDYDAEVWVGKFALETPTDDGEVMPWSTEKLVAVVVSGEYVGTSVSGGGVTSDFDMCVSSVE